LQQIAEGNRSMTNMAAFALAVLLVLSMPGPTNTLLALAGATLRLQKCALLPVAELAGYTITICTLLLLVRPITEGSTVLTAAIRLVSACYLLGLARHLWCVQEQVENARTGFRRVFITTLLNPKGVVFAFVIFPNPSSSFWSLGESLLTFTVICVACSATWITVGATLGHRAGAYVGARGIRRSAAVVLGCFAVLTFGSVAFVLG